ncbi:hypothetical protein [Paracoccus liaowanqingii]|uniref:hypothetical protein n=1 Tax=Paracoccus liaowanqingii TaxID=2560053 RepID=UPI001E39E01F|nr:hypothetical protein [Paracoccus liaowanqingii]
MAFREDISGLFDEYDEASTCDDAEVFSRLCDQVSLLQTPIGNFSIERQAVRDHCVTPMDFYRRENIVRPEGKLISATELFPNVAQACMAYRMFGEGDELVAEWEHVYILPRSDRWRVSLTIADRKWPHGSPKPYNFNRKRNNL